MSAAGTKMRLDSDDLALVAAALRLGEKPALIVRRRGAAQSVFIVRVAGKIIARVRWNRASADNVDLAFEVTNSRLAWGSPLWGETIDDALDAALGVPQDPYRWEGWTDVIIEKLR